MGKIPLRSPKHMTALFSLHVYFAHSLAALKFNFTCFLSFHASNLNCFCQNVEDFDWFSISFLIIFTSFSRQPSVRWTQHFLPHWNYLNFSLKKIQGPLQVIIIKAGKYKTNPSSPWACHQIWHNWELIIWGNVSLKLNILTS